MDVVGTKIAQEYSVREGGNNFSSDKPQFFSSFIFSVNTLYSKRTFNVELLPNLALTKSHKYINISGSLHVSGTHI